MGTTTHVDLRLRAHRAKIKTRMIHAASVACVRRLQSYKFGRTVTVPVTWQSEFPKGVYSGIKNNLTLGLHSLVLLEIDVEDKRHVSIPEAIKQLVDF